MSTRADTVAYLSDLANLGQRLAAKRMFGEYALYVDTKVVALVCDDQLFLKPTQAARALLTQVREGQPFPGAKPWWLLDGELDEPGLLSALLTATAEALPQPKPKAARKPKATAPAKAARGAQARQPKTPS